MALGGVSAVRAVLVDVLGTLVELRPPAPALRRALREEAGVDIGDETAQRAFGAEIEHYRAHHLEGGTPEGLERLRDDCAAVLHEAIGEPDLDRALVREAMLAALEFAPYPDAAPALRELRRRGLRLVAVSNWDCSLAKWLERARLGELLDGAVSSAAAGEAKPAPAPFRAAIELAGVAPAEAVHVGDSPVADIEGAAGVGVRAVLIDRARVSDPAAGRIASLAEVASLI